jgi:hypothetical protein
MNPIEAAVAPLEADAVGRAEKYARARVADFVSKLEAAGSRLTQVRTAFRSLNTG